MFESAICHWPTPWKSSTFGTLLTLSRRNGAPQSTWAPARAMFRRNCCARACVLGIEADPSLAASIRLRFGAESRERRFQLELASTVERDAGLTGMLNAHGFREIGVARVAASNAPWSALNALIDRRRDLPAIVTFQVGCDSGDVARGCIGFLWAHGYGTFDVFIKRGTDPVAAERFAGTELPAMWRSCAGGGLSAGFVAYHASRAADARRNRAGSSPTSRSSSPSTCSARRWSTKLARTMKTVWRGSAWMGW